MLIVLYDLRIPSVAVALPSVVFVVLRGVSPHVLAVPRSASLRVLVVPSVLEFFQLHVACYPPASVMNWDMVAADIVVSWVLSLWSSD